MYFNKKIVSDDTYLGLAAQGLFTTTVCCVTLVLRLDS